MRREVVYLSDPLRITCAILNCLPLPGLGAMIAGAKNPHSPFLRHGILQFLLVLFGAWPLIVPGVIGLLWAIWDGVQIGTKGRTPAHWSQPTPNAPPESIVPDPAIARAARKDERLRAREIARKEAALRREARTALRSEHRARKQDQRQQQEQQRAANQAAKQTERAASRAQSRSRQKQPKS